ncbi:MAG: alpha/beta fold hydrolase [Bacteroidetes bacterium]|nr:alpha/beta fold hydrolase [Bacteroidota bacterium]
MKKRYIVLLIFLAVLLLPYLLLSMRVSDQAAIREFKHKGLSLQTHTAVIAGHHLHYVSTGSDTLPAMIFIHGSPGSWYAFRRYLMDTSLLSHYHLIAIDRPGFGYSDFGYGVHLPVQAQIVAGFIDSIRHGRPLYLVGHSLGGTLAPLVAAERPDSVDGLVLLAGAMDTLTEPAEHWRGFFTGPVTRYLMPGALRPSTEEEWWYKTEMYHYPDHLGRIHCPVYLLHAEDDHIVDIANVQYLKNAMPHAIISVKRFKSGGHYIPWNHKDSILSILLSQSKNNSAIK